jgi:hypothetical protein
MRESIDGAAGASRAFSLPGRGDTFGLRGWGGLVQVARRLED